MPLSSGAVEGDWLRCPFHGWAYAGDGRCTLIPSNGADSPIPNGARARAYPVQERGGYIWVYMGVACGRQRPVLEVPEELVSTEWVVGRHYDDVAANYTRVVEQTIDVAHVPWVHRRTIGHAMIPDARIDRPMVTRDTGLSFYFKGPMPNSLEVFQRLNQRWAPGSSTPRDGLHFDMPNLFRVFQGGMIMGLYAVPLDEANSRIYQYVARGWLRRAPVLSALLTWLSLRINRVIVREDIRMLELQSLKRMPEGSAKEFQVRADRGEIYYRKLRARYFDSHPYERPSSGRVQEQQVGAQRD